MVPVCFRSPKVCYKDVADSFPYCVILGGHHLHKCVLHEAGCNDWCHVLMDIPIWLNLHWHLPA